MLGNNIKYGRESWGTCWGCSWNRAVCPSLGAVCSSSCRGSSCTVDQLSFRVKPLFYLRIVGLVFHVATEQWGRHADCWWECRPICTLNGTVTAGTAWPLSPCHVHSVTPAAFRFSCCISKTVFQTAFSPTETRMINLHIIGLDEDYLVV